jgi:peptidoglycan/xylan/chitin deacetylase (PgdA/CDA1 family)
VLATAGRRLRHGRLRALVSHRVIDPHAQGAVVLDGRHEVRLIHRLRGGARLHVTDGQDRIEASVRQVVDTPVPNLPIVEHWLIHAGIPGHRSWMVGTRSGERMEEPGGHDMVGASPEAGNVIGLTFDDGPDPTWTPIVLAVLRDKGVKATFCDVGYRVFELPDLVRAELAQGHTLCDHTNGHVVNLPLKPHPEIEAQVADGARVIHDVSGTWPAIYRPPGGTLSQEVVDVARAHGMRTLHWSCDPQDYRRPPPPVLLERILGCLQPGVVVLMHDGGGDRSSTVAMLSALIDGARARGFTFSTPADMPAA